MLENIPKTFADVAEEAAYLAPLLRLKPPADSGKAVLCAQWVALFGTGQLFPLSASGTPALRTPGPVCTEEEALQKFEAAANVAMAARASGAAPAAFPALPWEVLFPLIVNLIQKWLKK